MSRLWGLVFLAFAGIAHAADIAGTWSGLWTKNGDDLSVTVTLNSSGDGYTGSFDSDGLQVAGIPFQKITAAKHKVHFVLSGDESVTTFDGTLTGNRIDGSFVDGNTKGKFHLVRVPAPARAVRSRDVTFVDGDVTLAGTLIAPDSGGPYPAIMFLHGSGGEGRWANRYLAERFASAGFAALITDKRGVGQSTGDWHTAGFEDLADDAAAGIRFLRAQPEIVAGKIGIYGHSQGGTLAPLAAIRAGQIAFVIGSAAGGIDPAEMEEYSLGNSLGVSTLPPAEAADAKLFAHAIVGFGYRGVPREELDRVAAGFKGRAWYFDPPPPQASYWSFSRRIAAYQPADQWRQVKAPVLLLFGERDERVPPVQSSSAIVTALHAGGNDDVTLRMYPGADHTFTLATRDGGWPKHVPGYADALIAWARSKTK